jgi:hypothetical protein
LPAVIRGTDRASSAAEAADFADLAQERDCFAASALLYGDAFARDPERAADLKSARRYYAAGYAALAGCGQGKDDPAPDATSRANLRRQALAWLKADLTLRNRQFESGTHEARTEVLGVVAYWKGDPALAGVRDPEALAKLPDEEQPAWRALWADVDSLEKKARGHRPQP